MQQGNLVFDILDGLLQFPAAASGLRFDTPHRGPGRFKIRLCGVDGRLLHGDGVTKWLLVQFDKNIALFHAIVVIHQNPGDLTVDAGGNQRHMAIHESVVSRSRAEHKPDPGNTEHRGRDDDGAERTDQQIHPQREPLDRGWL